MKRPITLFTGQWADLPIKDLAPLAKEMGYEGLELACWGDHFEVDKALESDSYIRERQDLLTKHGLKVFCVGNHLVGQAVCDPIDKRYQAMLPPSVWGDGNEEGVRRRAAEFMKDTARAAARIGATTVSGFTGSSIWSKFYFFPPTSYSVIDDGYADFADRWNPILDVFDEEGVKFALEVHPGEIAYDLHTTQRSLEAVRFRTAFGFNFDPSHLYWQFVEPVNFIDRFGDRIFHVHMKDAIRKLDGTTSIFGSHLDFGDHRRGWNFRSVGRGGIDFQEIIRALNRVGYEGPLSVEWEDAGMERVHGATESAAYTRSVSFEASGQAHDAAFVRE